MRHVLAAIRVPTLVLHRIGDRDSNIEEGRYIASHIPGAKFVELPGEDHLLFVGDQDAVLREVESFISNSGRAADVDSVLATVLYIAATSKTKEKGSDTRRFIVLAKREVEWFKGRVSEANDNELCAIFDGPIRAIRCARAIRDSALELDIQTRAGLHTGLCEMRGDHAAGVAVEISKRVADRAAAGEVVLTNTVTDLVSGSEIVFSNRGSWSFEGLLSDCRLFATV